MCLIGVVILFVIGIIINVSFVVVGVGFSIVVNDCCSVGIVFISFNVVVCFCCLYCYRKYND